MLDRLATAKQKEQSSYCREQADGMRKKSKSVFHGEAFSKSREGSCSDKVKELSKKRHGRNERKKFSSKTSPLACLRASDRSLVLPTSKILSVFRSTALRRSFSSS
jgi:hypothetical protein